jgi:hypothetical protein
MACTRVPEPRARSVRQMFDDRTVAGAEVDTSAASDTLMNRQTICSGADVCRSRSSSGRPASKSAGESSRRRYGHAIIKAAARARTIPVRLRACGPTMPDRAVGTP